MLILACLFLLLLPRIVLGATINAASCSIADITTAITAAAVGDTVHLPTCNQTTWTSTVTITKRIILEGNGPANTILNRSAVSATFFSNPMFRVTGVTGFEMRDMTLDGTQDTNPTEWQETALWLEDCVDFRIHHMVFRDFAQGILADGNPTVQRGLIDHNTFTDNYCTPNCGGTGGSLGYGVHVLGTGTYPALSLGTAQNVFVEDNIFNGATGNRHNIASNNGARYVFRYNDIQTSGVNAAAVDAHGYVTSWTTGTRQYEIYHNTLTYGGSQFVGIGPRGGDGVIFNNVITPATSNRDIHLMNDFVNGGSNTSNCPGAYPMLYQIRELYIWGNTRPGGAAAQVNVISGCTSAIQVNRDYFLTARPGYTPYTYPHPGQGGAAPVPDYTTALRMHLKFDEGTGTTAQDSTANNHDGTLVNGATWGAAQMGASALLLDGTNDEVTVTGLLTSPAAITLAAWVLPSSYGTGGADVISLGNVVTLRVSATQVLAHAWSGTAFTTLSASRPTTAVWHHVAYTATAGAQRLYVNGSLVASGSGGAALGYTGQGSQTFIGTHGNAATTTRFGGQIDDVRVYTRALSPTDVAGLAALEDPPPLAIQITTPTSSDAYSTSSALLANLGGVASDDTGVTGMTVTCPTCTAASPVTCTPACGAATTFTNWHIPSMTLATGSNLVTVTAHDASGTRTDALTATYTPPPPAGTCSHYASQAGGGNGLSQGSPFRVVDFWAVASAGTTLCLVDGTYTGGNSMLQPPGGLSGTASLPITVQAATDGAVLLDGQNARNPVVLGATNAWFVVQGLNARNGLTAVYEFLGSNNTGKRLIGWNATTGQPHATIFTVRGTNTVIEDCAGWGDNARVILQGSGTVSSPGSGYRRCFCEWNDHPEGGLTAGACAAPGVGQRFENVVGTIQRTGQ